MGKKIKSEGNFVRRENAPRKIRKRKVEENYEGMERKNVEDFELSFDYFLRIVKEAKNINPEIAQSAKYIIRQIKLLKGLKKSVEKWFIPTLEKFSPQGEYANIIEDYLSDKNRGLAESEITDIKMTTEEVKTYFARLIEMYVEGS